MNFNLIVILENVNIYLAFNTPVIPRVVIALEGENAGTGMQKKVRSGIET